MQSNFRVFKELVFFNFWIPVSAFRIPDSGFKFPVSGFRFQFPCFRVAEITMLEFGSVLRGKKDGGFTFYHITMRA